MIASGEKKEEYRDYTEFWQARLMLYDITERNNITPHKRYYDYKKFDTVTFQHGYRRDASRMVFEFKGVEARNGKPEWGAEPGKEYFVISLGKRIS
jgi:hypothetical protein